jgi:hypothetical protein
VSLRTFIVAALVIASAAVARPAAANPKVLPFTYGTMTTTPGHYEVEQYIDVIGVRLARELPNGSAESTTVPRYQLQTELEYGVTPKLEVALYLAFGQGASIDNSALFFDGMKQRLRYRFADPGQWPVDVGVYLELAELRDEIELEEKVLLERRFGKVRAMANLVVEQERNFIEDESEYIYAPSVGVSYELHPQASIGLEYWTKGNFDGTAPPHYAGPTVMVQEGEYWLAAGAYARLDGLGNATAIDDPYGRVWVRVIAGIGL